MISEEAGGKSLLAIVIITRNEARNVARCIESVLAAASRYTDTQVVMVDSASTDETCAIARRHPLSILQLRPDWLLTPAAGRYIGTLVTDSEYILYVDGDMVLDTDWVERGLAFLKGQPQVAAVSGGLEEIYLDDTNQVVGRIPNRYPTREPIEVPGFGGVGLYRRSALEVAGTFNPFVTLREEAELGLRLRRAGYCLYRLPEHVATHYSAPRQTLSEVRRRLSAGYYAGFGRALYYSARSGLGGQFLREQGTAFSSFGVYLLAGIASALALMVKRKWVPLGIWTAATAAGLGAYALKKGGIRNAALGYLTRTLIVYGAVTGTLAALFDPPAYPTDVNVIQLGRLGRIGPGMVVSGASAPAVNKGD